MTGLFLCDARRQIRSIVELCEEFGVRRAVQKETHQNELIKIVNDGPIFARSKAMKAEHT